MARFTDQQVLLDSVTVLTADFVGEADDDTLTAVAHGLSNEDRVTLTNSAGGLPGGLSAGVWYYVVNATDDTFQLAATSGGAAIALSSDGTGTQTFYKEYLGIVDVQSFDFIVLSIDTADSADATLRFRGSVLDTAPDFSAARTAAIQWDNLAAYDLEDISTNLPAMVRGDTGIDFNGTDDHRLLKIDTSGLKWLAAITQTFLAGSIRVVAKLNAEFHD